MSKKWVDVDKISSIAGRSKKYTDDKIADLANTTLDAVADLESGKQDLLFGYEGYELVFDEDSNPVAVTRSPRDNFLPGTNFSNPEEFYLKWDRSNTDKISIKSNEYVEFEEDGNISIDLGIDVLNAIRNKWIILSFVGTGTIDALSAYLKSGTISGYLSSSIHIYDSVTTKKQLAYDTRKSETTNTGLTGIRVKVSGEAGARLYGIKLELGSTQTLAYYDPANHGYELISQYPDRIFGANSVDTSDKVSIPVATSGPGKGPGNVIVYDDEENTKFQTVTPNHNYLKNSIFVELNPYDDWPENWFRSDTAGISLGSTSIGGLSGRPVVIFNTAGHISIDIPLNEFSLIKEYFTISALCRGSASLYSKIEQNNFLVQNAIYDAKTETVVENFLEVDNPSKNTDEYKWEVISITGCIAINVENLSDYVLHIGVSGGAGNNSASVQAVKLESGFNQTLAYYHKSSTYEGMRLIPQSPVISNPSSTTQNLITGVNIFPEASVGELIHIENSADDEWFKYIGFTTNAIAKYVPNSLEYRPHIDFSMKTNSQSIEMLVCDYNNRNIKKILRNNFKITASALVLKTGGTLQYGVQLRHTNESSLMVAPYENVSIENNVITLISLTYDVPFEDEDFIHMAYLILKLTSGTDDCRLKIFDLKIEYGERSTLCNKVNNSYISNGIPGNRPEDILALGLTASSTNLIKNSYFSKKRALNTQGKTTYTISNTGIETINNWIIYAPYGGTSTFTLGTYYSSITPKTNGIHAYFYTTIDANRLDQSGHSIPYTFSWCIIGTISEHYVITIGRKSNNGELIDDKFLTIYNGTDTGYNVRTFYLPSLDNVKYVEIGFSAFSEINLVFADMTVGFHANSYDNKNGINLAYVNSYDFGAITIPQGQHMSVGYNENGRLVPVLTSPKPNLLKNADFSNVSKVLINGAYSSTNYTINTWLLDSPGANPVYEWKFYATNGSSSCTFGQNGATITEIIPGSNSYLAQYFSENTYRDIKHSMFTISACIYINGVYSISTITGKLPSTLSSDYAPLVKNFSTHNIRLVYRESDAHVQIEPLVSSIMIVAMKIELGATQTLGYIENNKLILLDKWEPIETYGTSLAALSDRVTALEQDSAVSTMDNWRISLPLNIQCLIGQGYVTSTSKKPQAIITILLDNINLPVSVITATSQLYLNRQNVNYKIVFTDINGSHRTLNNSKDDIINLNIVYASKNMLIVSMNSLVTWTDNIGADSPVSLYATAISSDGYLYIS